MKLKFFKMQASGNDYIYFDTDFCDGDYIKRNAESLSRNLSRRRFSIGSDGIVIIDKSKTCDLKMIIYNSDGTRAKNCGNALRSVGYYTSEKLSKDLISVETDSGVRVVERHGKIVSVCMGQPEIINVPAEKVYGKDKLDYLNKSVFYQFVTVGNPHLVVYLGDGKSGDNGLIAPLLTKCKGVFDGINVEIVTTCNDKIFVTVYERGSGETLCCGTGATAVYYSLVKKGVIENKRCALNFKGGRVFTEYKNGDIYLSGEVKFCYEGVIDYDTYK